MEKKNYIIETERLKLRELTLDDTDKLALVLSDPQSMRFYPHPFSREEVEHWIKWNIDNYKKYGFGLWAVIEKESGEFIGDCGITMQQVEDDLFHEIGYHLRKEYRGRGVAKTLVTLLRNETFRRGAIPYYGTGLSNLASWKTALECGFKPFWVEAESQPDEKLEFVK